MTLQYQAVEHLCFIGILDRIDEDGRAFVDFPDNDRGPLEARLACSTDPAVAAGAEVLLVLERGDPYRPIILGFVRDRFPVQKPARVTATCVPVSTRLNIDGRQMQFTATDQIVLQCGRGSITLSADGVIEVKGTRITSRSSGTHRIRGATVRIN